MSCISTLSPHCMPTLHRGWTITDFVTKQEYDYLNAVYDQLCCKQKTSKTLQFIRSLSTPSVVRAEERAQICKPQALTLRGIVGSIEERIRCVLPDTLLNSAGQECRFVGVGENITVSVHRGPSRGIGRHVDSKRHTEFGPVHSDTGAGADTIDVDQRSIECLYKFAVYLSRNSTAGTAFYDSKKSKHPLYVTDGTERSATIFDMREWHSGTEIAAGTEKRVFGLRLFFQRI